jgi:hypothetical protein
VLGLSVANQLVNTIFKQGGRQQFAGAFGVLAKNQKRAFMTDKNVFFKWLLSARQLLPRSIVNHTNYMFGLKRGTHVGNKALHCAQRAQLLPQNKMINKPNMIWVLRTSMIE